MIVDGWYVPNTPTLVVNEDWKVNGFQARPKTLAALKDAGERARKQGVDTVIVVSPHFEARGLLPVVAADQPKQIYDFDGFPQAFYDVEYAPRGDRAFAQQILALASEAALPVTAVDQEWGLDHGAWAPLSRMFPDAALATVPVGIGSGISDADHQRLGAILARASGERRVVVVATGSLLHRLDLWGGRTRTADPAIAEALGHAEAALASGDWNAVWNLPQEELRLLQPEGGLRPLRVLAGAVGEGFRPELLSTESEFGAASLTVMRIRPAILATA